MKTGAVKFCIYLEKCDKNVWFGPSQENEGEEGGEATVEDSWTNLLQRLPYSVISAALAREEGVSDVRRVVHAETDADDDVGAGDSVDGETPEVDESPNIDQRQHNTTQHLQFTKYLYYVISSSLFSSVKILTNKLAVKLNSNIQVVIKTHNMAKKIFLYNSSDIT